MSETRGESYPCEPTFEVPLPGLVRIRIKNRRVESVCVVDMMSMMAATILLIVKMAVGAVRA